MFDIIILFSLIVLSILLTIAIVRFGSRQGNWNSYESAIAGFLFFFIILATLVFVVFAGPLMPLEAWTNQWRVAKLEQYLHVGEPRSVFEAELGVKIPMPDLRSCCGTAPQQNQPGSKKGHERYYYLVAGAICLAEYQGVAVRFDRRDRIRSWRHVALADGF